MNEDGNITQGGVEIPQFSTAFEKYYNNQTQNFTYCYKSDYSGLTNGDKNLGNIQSSYKNLRFPFNKNIDKQGNTVYTYQGYVDKNRYYNTSTSNFALGEGIHGFAYYHDDDRKDYETQKQGYYPFNPTNRNRPINPRHE